MEEDEGERRVWGMPLPPAFPPRRVPSDIARQLADIDAHVQQIATNQADSELSVLAYAIHNLITVMKRLHESTSNQT